MRAHLPILPLLISLGGALVIPVVALVSRRAAWPLAVIAAIGAAAAAVAGLWDVVGHGARHYAVGGWPPPWGIELVLDLLSAWSAAAVAGVAAMAMLSAGPDVARREGEGAPVFYALALLALAGFLGIIASGDMFNVFVFLEIAAIASYALVASGGGPALTAGFRYVVLGTVGGSFYLLGVGFLYALTGTLNMADLAARLPASTDSPLFVGGVVFVAIGLGIKMAIFPLHGWLPDAYTYAPSAVAGLLTGVATKAAAYALARMVWYVLRPHELPVATLLAWAGASAIVVGGVLALRQVDARRLLAYSSISHLGYIALGFGLGNAVGLAGAYLHILNHAVMKAALFIAVGAALYGGGRPALAALGLGRSMPITAACAVVAALSLIGLPPTGGFFSKWYLLQGALQAGQPVFVAVVLAGSLLAVGYTYRLTEAIWVGNASGPAPPEAPPSMRLALIVLAVATVAIGLGSAALMRTVLLPATAGVF